MLFVIARDLVIGGGSRRREADALVPTVDGGPSAYARTLVRSYARINELDNATFVRTLGLVVKAASPHGRRWSGHAPVSSSAQAARVTVVTTYRIYADQRDALQRAALERRGSGSGRADASAILREVLDQAGLGSDAE